MDPYAPPCDVGMRIRPMSGPQVFLGSDGDVRWWQALKGCPHELHRRRQLGWGTETLAVSRFAVVSSPEVMPHG